MLGVRGRAASGDEAVFMSTKVIYHRSDFDGIFCREIAKKFLPDAELIGWDYGDPEPYVSKDDDLYILDLSVPSLMEHPKLIWIDHHKSAIEKYRRDAKSPSSYLIDGVAACRLAWQWFTHETANQVMSDARYLPDKEDYVERRVKEPTAVRLAGEYDIWDRRDPNAELFQHGLRSRELTTEDWTDLLASTPFRGGIVEDLLEAAKVVQYVQRQSDKAAIEACGYSLQWEGLTFLAVNAGARGFNSFLFIAGLKPEHDACLGWRMVKPGKYSVSLYHAPGKEHHDLSLIATKYGGGGHRGACGYTCESLPFE